MDFRTNLSTRILRWGPAIAPALILTFFIALPLPVATAQPVWSGLNGGSEAGASALIVHDEDGPGPGSSMLYVGGGYGTFATTSYMKTLIRWDGWEPFPFVDGLSAVGGLSFHVNPRSLGPIKTGLFVGGMQPPTAPPPLNNPSRWFDGQWHGVGGGVTQPDPYYTHLFSMRNYEEPGAPSHTTPLIVGGLFRFAGGKPIESLARWDGMNWSQVGGGIRSSYPNTTAVVYDAIVFDDDGPGPRPPAFYVGGGFDYAGSVTAHNIARWDGQNWEPLGPGFNSAVNALAVFDEDGPGPKLPALFAGGSFNGLWGGPFQTHSRIARWDGQTWTPVGGWISSGGVEDLFVVDEDGPGPLPESMYMGGLFNVLPGGTLVNKIARWDGQKWHKVGEGVSGFGAGTHVGSIELFDEDGPGPNPGGLYVGGLFYYAGSVYSKHIARWGEPLPPKCSPDCDKDADLDLFDFLCFQGRFAAADPWADFERDGDHDLFDFLEFQGQFASGCP